MKKQITTITLGILMIAGAMAMYAGNEMTFETNLTNPYYTVTGNASSLEGLNITFNSGNITISTPLNYKSDNFTLIFFDNETREVVKTVYRGSGGSTRTRYVDKNVTVYFPEYINTTETIEVERIIDTIKYQDTGLKTWHLLLTALLGIALTILVVWLIERRQDD